MTIRNLAHAIYRGAKVKAPLTGFPRMGERPLVVDRKKLVIVTEGMEITQAELNGKLTIAGHTVGKPQCRRWYCFAPMDAAQVRQEIQKWAIRERRARAKVRPRPCTKEERLRKRQIAALEKKIRAIERKHIFTPVRPFNPVLATPGAIPEWEPDQWRRWREQKPLRLQAYRIIKAANGDAQKAKAALDAAGFAVSPLFWLSTADIGWTIHWDCGLVRRPVSGKLREPSHSERNWFCACLRAWKQRESMLTPLRDAIARLERGEEVNIGEYFEDEEPELDAEEVAA